MQKVIVPLDFSECSSNALHYTAEMITHSNFLTKECKIILHHTYSPTLLKDPDKVELEVKEKIQNEIKKIINSHSEIQADQFQIHVASGEVVYNICQLAERNDSAFIVMGTTGASGLEKIFLGTLTDDVVRNCNCPLLAVPEKVTQFDFKNITYASDFQVQKHDNSLDPLVSFVGWQNAHLSIIHIDKSNQRASYEEFIESSREAKMFSNLSHTFVRLEEDNIDEGIRKFIEEKKQSLLAIVRHEKSLWQEMFSHSHSSEMVYEAFVPVLVLPE